MLVSIIIRRELGYVERKMDNYRSMIWRIRNGGDCILTEEELLESINEGYEYIKEESAKIREKYRIKYIK